MKRGWIFVILVTLFLMFLNHAVADSKTISIGADVWHPYNGVAKSSELGFMIDIAVEVFKEKGYTVDYKNLPWNRAKDECRKGNIDAVVGAFIDDVPDFIFP
ncbi:MAG: transporter substrate-binding domain-containing protein [SAR324 cluster bacterium]|nr:transporter substrate-binding domain-containing protein [SAR324 cluster bacterium]